MGATAGIADTIAVALTDRGVTAEVRPADDAPDPAGYDGVIVCSALYTGHWMTAPRHYIERHAEQLRRQAVWLFSSGPLDASAEETEIAPVHAVEDLALRIRARDHETFGGKLDRLQAHGFVAKLMARSQSGDWRDQQHIVAWADRIADELESRGHHPSALDPTADPRRPATNALTPPRARRGRLRPRRIRGRVTVIPTCAASMREVPRADDADDARCPPPPRDADGGRQGSAPPLDQVVRRSWAHPPP
jgi:menaquinone-dependent protoporphyrinogen oxidase